MPEKRSFRILTRLVVGTASVAAFALAVDVVLAVAVTSLEGDGARAHRRVEAEGDVRSTKGALRNENEKEAVTLLQASVHAGRLRFFVLRRAGEEIALSNLVPSEFSDALFPTKETFGFTVGAYALTYAIATPSVRQRLQAELTGRASRLATDVLILFLAMAAGLARRTALFSEDDASDASEPMDAPERPTSARPPEASLGFDCTIVRTVGTEATFEKLSSVVTRYGGTVLSTSLTGSSFSFEDRHCASSPQAALNAICELNDMVKEGRPQAWISRGNVLSLTGAPAVYRTSELRATNGCAIYFDRAIAQAVRAAGRSTEPDRDGVCEFLGLVSTDDLLASSSPEDWLVAGRRRSDVDGAAILRRLRRDLMTSSTQRFGTLTACLRDRKPDRLSDDLRRDYTMLLQELGEKARTSVDGPRYAHHLASAIAASRNLIPKAAFDKNLAATFRDFLRDEDKRVVANVLDVFAWFDPANDDVLFLHLLNHKDNRILANVLVKEAMRSFNKKVSRQIETMLESRNPYFTASGLFAVGEIAAHYRKIDRVYFGSHVHLQHLIDRGKKFCDDPNEMVARQAVALAAKSRGDLPGLEPSASKSGSVAA